MEITKEREIFSNPYIIRMDRFADSLKHLSEAFLHLEDYKGSFTGEELEEMFQEVTEKVCVVCGNREQCLGGDLAQTERMAYELFCTIEEYGAELNTEVKRKLQKQCMMAPRFLRETLEVFADAKRRLMWNNRIVQNREGCARSMITFADTIQEAARELGAGIFADERMEKRIRNQLRRIGIRAVNMVFFLSERGKYEIHLTLKADKGQCAATGEIARIVSRCAGRTMYPEAGEQPIIWEDYGMIILRERTGFYTRQGVAKASKGSQMVSGDTFLMKPLPGGKEGIVISDGMGSGEEAFRESAMVVEMMEELLMAGFSGKTAIQMLNTVLVMGREEVCFSTLDLCLVDLYEGSCELWKAGASATFLRRGNQIEKITSSSLPVGVVQNLELDMEKHSLQNGDYVIMVTDGVMDALPVGEQEVILGTIVLGTPERNPEEMAEHILEQVLRWTGEAPMDDMTVIVMGIWEL